MRLLIKTAAAGILLPFFLAQLSPAQLDQVLKNADESLSRRETSNLSEDKIITGLKQALQIGTTKAVALTGRPDGFLKNEAIKIVLPPRLETIGKALHTVGMGAQVDQLETGMNRAAEQSTPQARQIFLAALRKMSFTDARHILTGGDTAATEYFKRTSSSDLTAAFSLVVHRSMQRIGVVQQYQRVLKNAPGGSALAAEFDLDN